MNWDKANCEKLAVRRSSTFVEYPVLRPLENTFSGVEGGVLERLKLIEMEQRLKKQAYPKREQELQAIRQHNAAIKLARQERIAKNKITSGTNGVSAKTKKNTPPTLGLNHAKRAVLPQNTSSRILSGRRRGNVLSQPLQSHNYSKEPLLLSLAQTLIKAIKQGDMDAVANLASKIYGESF